MIVLYIFILCVRQNIQNAGLFEILFVVLLRFRDRIRYEYVFVTVFVFVE